MRELTDEQIHERLERSKAIRRREDQVVAHWLERLTVAQSAERLGVSARLVTYLRRHLRLSCGYAWRGGEERMGRVRDALVVVEVRR